MTLTKRELCEKLGWSRPKLDRRLQADPHFPIAKRGTETGGWEFDLNVVLAYLAASPEKALKTGRKPKTVAQEREELVTASARGARHLGEATAKQRRDQAQAAILEDKLRRERAELLEAEEVRTVVSTMLARFAKALDNLPDQIIKQFGLDDAKGPALRQMIDQTRTSMVNDVRKLIRA